LSNELNYRESRLADGTRIVTLGGQMDVFTAGAELEELLEECVESASHLMVDMSQVSFIDSIGLGLLVKTARRLSASGHRLAVLRPHANVRRLIEITGMERWLAVDSSEDEALLLAEGLLPKVADETHAADHAAKPP